ncbi:MAG: tRNA lysidine(34) synthetase TilS [Bacillales bacterium]
MKEIKINLDGNKKYILGCSNGPDSMALFFLLLNNNINFRVATVNYHLREESDKEVDNIINICKNFKIEYDILSVRRTDNSNVEDWAREVRYNFFNDIGKKHKIDNVLVAHHLDDLLETYLIQKQRNNIVDYYGIKRITKYKSINIIRPLLDFTKQDLIDYCAQKSISYSIDKTNLEDVYLRNKIRLNFISKIDKKDKESLKKEIDDKNNLLNTTNVFLSKLIVNNKIYLKDIIKLNEDEFNRLIILYFKKQNLFKPISKGYSNTLNNIFKSNKNYHEELDENIYLTIDYGVLQIQKLFFDKYYFYDSNEILLINKKSSFYKLIKEKKFIVTNDVNRSSKYYFKNGSKTLNRLFLDWKMPYLIRKIWPIVIDDNQNILYVPHYNKDYKEDKNSLLVFNLNDFITY